MSESRSFRGPFDVIPVSAVIITKNEEKHIGRCLASLDWAGEILVVDAESTDRTREICGDRARFLTRPWDGFRNQRNFAINEAKYDWILVVDADEQCSPELAAR